MTTLLLTGKTGQVGAELARTLAPLGTLIAPGRDQMDLASADSIRRAITSVKPDVIVNAAGFTIVDRAEEQPGLAMQINGIAPGVIAEAARKTDALFIHYSTAFVFDGTKRGPYTESDTPNPVNAYGRSKLAGEQAILDCGGDNIILRANWVYSARRTNFALTILELAREREELAIVDDQIGSPTWARAYAEATAQLVRQADRVRAHGGVYHLAAAGHCTRLQWAERLIETARALSGDRKGWARLRPTTTAEYPLRAARPLYTVTDNERIDALLGVRMPRWEEQLDAFFRESWPAVLARITAAQP